MKSKLFFWGSFLICLGTLLLLNNFDLIDFNMPNILNWWPLLLIIWGVALLKVPVILKNILFSLTGVLLALFIFVIFSNSVKFVGNITGPGDIFFIALNDDGCESSQDKTDDKITNAKLNFSGGAGSFKLATTNEYLYNISSGDLNCNVETDTPNDSTVVLNYDFAGSGIQGKSHQSNKLEIYDHLQWDIDLSAGASKMELNLEDLKIKHLNIDAGASNTSLKLGAKLPQTKVIINCGAATFNIEIPSSAGCSVQGDLALSKTKFEGMKLNSSGVYITENYYNSPNKIDFYIDGAISNIDIIRK